MGKENNLPVVVFKKVKDDIDKLNKNIDATKGDIDNLKLRIGAIEGQPSGGESSCPTINTDVLYDVVSIAVQNVLHKHFNEQDDDETEEPALQNVGQPTSVTIPTDCVEMAVKKALDQRYNDKNFNVSELSLALNEWTKDFSSAFDTKFEVLAKVIDRIYLENKRTSDNIHHICDALKYIVEQNGFKGAAKLNVILKPKWSGFANILVFIWDWIVWIARWIWSHQWLRIYVSWGKWIVWIMVIVISYFILQDNVRLNEYRERYIIHYRTCPLAHDPFINK